MMYPYYYNGFGGGMMSPWGGGVFMLVFWILIIALTVWIIRVLASRRYDRHFDRLGERSGSNSDAMEILRQRYAKGEINKEEFEEKKKDLLS